MVASSALGSSMTIVRPPPGVSSADTSPPIASASPRATASPRPTPSPDGRVAVPLERQEDLLAGLLGHPGAGVARRAPGCARRARWSTPAPGRAAAGGAARSRRRCRAPGRAGPGRPRRPGPPGRGSSRPGRARSPRRPPPAPPRRGRPAAATATSAPAWSRDMSSRLPMSASSRSAESSMAASSSASSSGEKVTSIERRLPIAALMPASGVRRSCETAESSAVRAELSRASAAASPAACCRARRWRMAPACAAKAASSRCRSAGTCTPTSTRSCSSSAVAWVCSSVAGCRSPGPRRVGAATSTSATTSAGVVGRWPRRTTTRALGAEHVDGVLEQHGHLVGGAEQGVGELGEGCRLALGRDRPLGPAGAGVHDERHDERRRRRRRRAQSRSPAAEIVRVRTGSRKNQLSSPDDATAPTMAGPMPPSRATSTVMSR